MSLDFFKTADKVEDKIYNLKGILSVVSPKEGRYGIRLNIKGFEDIWFNGSGEVPGIQGDELEIEYRVTPKEGGGSWYNIQKAINLSKINKKDGVDIQKVSTSESISKAVQKLANFTEYVTLMNAAVSLCIRKGTLMDSEIISTFGKLIDWIETYSQVIDTTKLPDGNTQRQEKTCQK